MLRASHSICLILIAFVENLQNCRAAECYTRQERALVAQALPASLPLACQKRSHARTLLLLPLGLEESFSARCRCKLSAKAGRSTYCLKVQQEMPAMRLRKPSSS